MKFKEIRKKIGYTQKEVAEKINTNRANYNRYELEKGEPDIKTLIKIADTFHVSVDELIGRENNNTIDKGLLDETELNIIEILRELNETNKLRLQSYIVALYQTQQDHQEITNKLKRN